MRPRRKSVKNLFEPLETVEDSPDGIILAENKILKDGSLACLVIDEVLKGEERRATYFVIYLNFLWTHRSLN
jgi:hypothetical protein